MATKAQIKASNSRMIRTYGVTKHEPWYEDVLSAIESGELTLPQEGAKGWLELRDFVHNWTPSNHPA